MAVKVLDNQGNEHILLDKNEAAQEIDTRATETAQTLESKFEQLSETTQTTVKEAVIESLKEEGIGAQTETFIIETDKAEEAIKGPAGFITDETKLGDIAIIKLKIAEELYSYTSYINSLVGDTLTWIAMDGNYDASNVYFKKDLTITQDIGTFKLNGAKSSNIATTGKSLETVFSSMLAEEKQSTKTDPTFKISSLTASTPNNDLEIGTYISTVTVDTSFTDGKYSEGTVDSTGKNYSSNVNAGCKVDTYELSNSLLPSSANITTKSGTFKFSLPDKTEVISTNKETYAVSSGSGMEIIPGNTGSGDMIFEAVVPLLQLEKETEVKFKVTINQLPDTAFNSTEDYAEYFASTGTEWSGGDYAYTDLIIIDCGKEYPVNIAAGYVQPLTVAETTALTWCDITSQDYSGAEFESENIFSTSSLPKTFEVICTGTDFNLKLIEPQLGFNSITDFANRYSLDIEAEWGEVAPQLQINSTNNKSYCSITGKCTYKAPERLPATNIGNISTCAKIQAGTLEGNKELKLTGYRKCFYKINNNIISINELKALTSDTIRSTFTCDSETPSALPTTLKLTKGTQQLVFLAPAGTYTKFSVTDVTNPQATFTLGNTKYDKALKVKGANNFASMDYDMWVISLDVPYPTDATINIERSK